MKLIESKYKKGKVITTFSNFVGYLAESQSYDYKEVAKKINRTTLWLSINKPFYGELLSHVNLWGSYDLDPNTMTTNGRDIIFHPEFIINQTEKSLRFAIMHELLHCVSEHQDKRENRDLKLWNIACDYAVNPILKDESDIDPPVTSSGEKAFIYAEELAGKRAEEIYDIIIKSRNHLKEIPKSETGFVIDYDSELPNPDPNLIIYIEGDEEYEKSQDEVEQEDPDKQPGSETESENDNDEEAGDESGATGSGTEDAGEEGNEPGATGSGTEDAGEEGNETGPTGSGTGDGGEEGNETGPTGSGTGEGGEEGNETGPTGNEPGATGSGTGPTGDEKKGVKVSVGDKVMTSEGRGKVTKIYPNGDIEVNLD